MTTMSPASFTIQTEQLLVTYEAHGPEEGPPVLLLHGWSDDVRAWDGVAPALAAAGHRVYVPYLRGFGPTRFLDGATSRTGQPTALAKDAVELLDALGVEKPSSPATIGREGGLRAGRPVARAGEAARGDVLTLPGGRFRPARSWPTPSSVSTGISGSSAPSGVGRRCGTTAASLAVSSGKRGRPPGASLKPSSRRRPRPGTTQTSWTWCCTSTACAGATRRRTRATRRGTPSWRHSEITVPTLLQHGEAEECSLPRSTVKQAKLFTGKYERRLLPGIGHFVPCEQPEAAVDAILGR